MNLKEQLYVVTVANAGTLAAASKILHVTPSALSLYISNLENHLSKKLFQRTNKRFVPTNVGKLYIESANRMLNIKSEFDQAMQALEYEKIKVRIGIQNIRTPQFIPFILYHFTNTDATLNWVEENYKELETMLLDNDIDMFICNIPYFHSKFEYINLFTDTISLMINKSNPLLEKNNYKKANLHNFKNERFILQYPTQTTGYYSKMILDENNIKPTSIFYSKKISASSAIVNAGLGVGFIPNSYIKLIPNVENIKLLPIEGVNIRISCAIVSLKNKKLHQKKIRFIESFYEVFNLNSTNAIKKLSLK